MSTTTINSRPAETLADRILTERVISLMTAAAKLGQGRGGRPVHPATLTRWIRKGISRPGGRVRLEAVRVGGAWKTSEESVRRFAEALTGDDAPPPTVRTPTARRKASERAEAALIKAGC